MLAIRQAVPEDAGNIVAMIRELAEFERQLDYVVITPEDIRRDGFGPHARFQTLLAEWDGQPAAYALFFFTYSTWAGRPSLYVEDLYVRAQFRGRGIGKELLRHMARIARKQNCQGMRWEVLDWNTPAIDFYRSLGAKIHRDWLPVRFTGVAFDEFAEEGR